METTNYNAGTFIAYLTTTSSGGFYAYDHRDHLLAGFRERHGHPPRALGAKDDAGCGAAGPRCCRPVAVATRIQAMVESARQRRGSLEEFGGRQVVLEERLPSLRVQVQGSRW